MTLTRWEIVIDHSKTVVDFSFDREEALRMADARTRADMILHTIQPNNDPIVESANA